MRIVYTGGGTGGHIFPLLATHSHLEKLISEEKHMKLEAFYVGSNGFARTLLGDRHISRWIVSAGKLHRYASFTQVLDTAKFFIGFFQAFAYLWWIMPDVVLSKGGYGSFWIVAIAWLFRIPVVVHESDSIPGLVNRIFARFASRVFVSFEYTLRYFPREKVVLYGNPTRDTLFTVFSGDPRKPLGILSQKPVIFVVGGSQGSQKLNGVVIEVLPQLIGKYEIVHQCGKENYEEFQKEVSGVLGRKGDSSYHAYPFLNEALLSHAYRASDLIISRAGSGSMFEIARAGKPSILIPLENSASDHQRKNAFVYAQAGAGIVLEESNLTPHLLLREIDAIFGDLRKQDLMAENARAFARPEAASVVAGEIIQLIS